MAGVRVTNLEIQKWVVRTHGFVPERDGIEHCKQLVGLVPQRRSDEVTINPCPTEKQALVMQALKRFGMV